jgi:GxxExxY protein
VKKVVGAAYEVSNILGAGFLEKIYERALLEEFHIRGVRVRAQAPYPEWSGNWICMDLQCFSRSRYSR